MHIYIIYIYINTFFMYIYIYITNSMFRGVIHQLTIPHWDFGSFFRHLKSDVADVYRCSNTAYMKIVHEDADMMLTMYISEDHIYIYIYIYPIWCHLFICSKIWGIRSYEYIGEIEIWPYPTCGWSDRWEDGEWWLSLWTMGHRSELQVV